MPPEIINKKVVVGSNTKLVNLPVMDAIMSVLQKLSNSSVAELDATEKLSSHILKESSAINNFFNEAVDLIEGKEEQSITVSIPSKFKPYLPALIKGKSSYYDISVKDRVVPKGIPYFLVMEIRKKGGANAKK